MKTGTTDPALGGGDPIYKGDIAKWLKLSNSLRARMAMRISKADRGQGGRGADGGVRGGRAAS